MGSIGKRGQKEEPYTENEIQEYLRWHFMTPNGAKYQMENLFVYRWESDYLHITRSGYAYEVEIKVTRSDFFNDMKKKDKHEILENKYVPKYGEKHEPSKPNYFYYAVPKDMIKPEEVPAHAGLIYIDRKTWPYVHVVVTAPKIHGEKVDEERLKLKEKFYYNYIQWKDKAQHKYQKEIDRLKDLLTEAKTDEATGIKYKYTLAEANEMIPFLDSQIKQKEKEINDLYDNNRELVREKLRLKHKLVDFGLSIREIQNIENGEENTNN